VIFLSHTHKRATTLFLLLCLNPLAPKVGEEWRPKVEGSEGRHICSGRRGTLKFFDYAGESQ